MTKPRRSGAAARTAGTPIPSATFVALLALLTGLGQFGSNVFLPGLPDLADEFAIGTALAALAYSVFLLAYGCGQLFLGPLTDRLGRRPVAIASAATFAFGSLVCAAAPGLPILVGGRFIQGVGVAGTLVIARAVARDQYQGAALRRVLATVTIAFALVPGLAPLVGGLLTEFVNWRATMWLSGAIGVATALWCWRQLPEPAGGVEGRSAEAATTVYARLLTDGPFVLQVLICAMSVASMGAFFSTSPALFLRVLGLSPIEYGMYPPLAVAGFVIGALVVRRAGAGRSERRILAGGVLLQAIGCVALIAPPVFGHLSVGQLAAAMVVFVSGLGIVHPVASAAAMSLRSDYGGQTASALGFVQMSFGAAATGMATLLFEHFPRTGMQATMASFTLLSAVLVWMVRSEASR